jgi:hypothetical protein
MASMVNALALLETLEQDSLRIHPQRRTCLVGVGALALGVILVVEHRAWPILMWNRSPAGSLDLGVSALTVCLGAGLLLLGSGSVSWASRQRLRASARAVRAAIRDVSAPLAMRETGPMPAVSASPPPAHPAGPQRAGGPARASYSGPLASLALGTGQTGPLASGQASPVAAGPLRSGRSGPLAASMSHSGQTAPHSVPPPPAPGARLQGLKRLSAVRAGDAAATEGVTAFVVLGPTMIAYMVLGGDIRLILSVILGLVGLAAIIAVQSLWRLHSFSVTVDNQGVRWRPGGRLRSVRVRWSEVRAVCRTTVKVNEDGRRQSIYVLDAPQAMLFWSIARPPRPTPSQAYSAGAPAPRARRPQPAQPGASQPESRAATSAERLLRYSLLCTGMPLRDLSKMIGATAQPARPHP